MNPLRKEPGIAQGSVNKEEITGDQHLMPGLKPKLVSQFNQPARHKTITTRGVARKAGVSETFVTTAVLRDLQEQVDELRSLVGHKGPSSATAGLSVMKARVA